MNVCPLPRVEADGGDSFVLCCGSLSWPVSLWDSSSWVPDGLCHTLFGIRKQDHCWLLPFVTQLTLFWQSLYYDFYRSSGKGFSHVHPVFFVESGCTVKIKSPVWQKFTTVQCHNLRCPVLPCDILITKSQHPGQQLLQTADRGFLPPGGRSPGLVLLTDVCGHTPRSLL